MAQHPGTVRGLGTRSSRQLPHLSWGDQSWDMCSHKAAGSLAAARWQGVRNL